MSLPPHLVSVDAELDALGCVMLGGSDALAVLLESATLDCFTLPEARTLFRALADLGTSGQPPLPGMIRDAIARLGLPPLSGEWLAQLVDSLTNAATLSAHCAILRDRAARRAAYLALIAGAEQAANLAVPLSETTAAAATALTTTTSADAAPPLRQIVLQAMDDIEREGKDGETPGLALGLPRVDHLTRGWQKGHLILVAARPSVGKTQFACQCVREACEGEQPTLFVTAEMSARQLARRLVALDADVDLLRLEPRHYARLAMAAGRVAAWPLDINAQAQTPGMVRLAADRMRREYGGLGLVVVDYVQLFRGDGRSENRNLEVGSVGRGLHRLALDLDVPVLALSQLSRDVEKGGTPRRPRLSDLRDSGELEQAADLVGFLHAVDTDDDVIHNVRRVDFILAKNRHGRRGTVSLDAYGSGRWREAPLDERPREQLEVA